MTKIIIAPDSFKGTLTASEVCEAIKFAALEVVPGSEVISIPIADGGEGTSDAIGARALPRRVTGPDFEPVNAFWGRLGNRAVIEMAAAAGLPLTKRKDPSLSTTFGVGELISAALDAGVRSFIIALGGSATNDCGCGMAAALGVRFYDEDGYSFIPTGGTLKDVARIDISRLDPRIGGSEFTAMCDITNPLYGKQGAAYVFAPQKGADKAMVERLDAGLRHISAVIEREVGVGVSGLPGGGAAGGMGAAAKAFLGASLRSGIDVILDAADFSDQLGEASIVITGEGRFDSQSLGGKAISGIAARTKAAGVPLVVIAGSAEPVPNAYEAGITAIFSIQRTPLPFEQAKLRSGRDLRETAANMLRLAAAAGMLGSE